MYSRFFFIPLFLLIFSCSKNDDASNDNGEEPQEIKYLKAVYYDGETRSDTLVYADNRLILRKEYIEDFLDYNHHFVYNSQNQLTRISKIHSTSTYPIEETTYTYYANGNLKTRHYEGYNSNYTETFNYYDNVIYINEGGNNEKKMNLNTNGQIASFEVYDEDSNEFFNILKFEYDNRGNLTKISDRYNRNDPYKTFIYTFDDKINPLFVFDYKMPNGFSIKQFEAVLSHSNYGGYSPGDDDNLFIYFSKNNFISMQSENGVGNYNFEYNAGNYPIKVTLPHNGNSINLTY
ncbi:MAG: hypothetical protein KDC94_12505 [Aequorivita sp.]|nr:hypothetical protein [Aequorivita sp.]